MAWTIQNRSAESGEVTSSGTLFLGNENNSLTGKANTEGGSLVLGGRDILVASTTTNSDSITNTTLDVNGTVSTISDFLNLHANQAIRFYQGDQTLVMTVDGNGITLPSSTPLSVASGGTGANNGADAAKNLGIALTKYITVTQNSSGYTTLTPVSDIYNYYQNAQAVFCKLELLDGTSYLVSMINSTEDNSYFGGLITNITGEKYWYYIIITSPNVVTVESYLFDALIAETALDKTTYQGTGTKAVYNSDRLGGVESSEYIQKSGGTFTGEVNASTVNTTSTTLRNIVVYESDDSTLASTGYIRMVRK